MAHAITWFEIPVLEMQRAVRFYETVLGSRLNPGPGGAPGFEMAMWPGEAGEVNGALVSGRGYEPSMTGSILYLGYAGDLNVPLARVEEAGGSIIQPKTDIGGGMCFYAFIRDTEGNRVGLHSMQ